MLKMDTVLFVEDRCCTVVGSLGWHLDNNCGQVHIVIMVMLYITKTCEVKSFITAKDL